MASKKQKVQDRTKKIISDAKKTIKKAAAPTKNINRASANKSRKSGGY